MKKSQITTFLVIGLVAITLVGMVIYFATSSTKRQGQKNVKVTRQSTLRTQQVSNLVDSCVEKLTKDSLILSSRQAGYIFTEQGGPGLLPSKYYDENFNGVTYHVAYVNNKNSNISIGYDEIAEQLKVYSTNMIKGCANFTTFELQGFDVTKTGAEEINIELLDNGVSLSLYYPIDVVYIKSGEKKSYSNFKFNIDVSLTNLYAVMQEIIEANEGTPFMSVESLNTFMNNNHPELDYESEYVPGDDNREDMLIKLKDPNLRIKGQDYGFWFVRDNWETS